VNVTGHIFPASGRSVSIRDVARAAGVSYQTVSRVINSQAGVRESTRRQVLRSIEELGYRPNRTAQALARGRARAVTVLTADTTLYGYATALRGIEEAARAEGFPVGIGVLDSPTPRAIRAAVDAVSDPRAGAVIVIAYDVAGMRALAAMPPGMAVGALVESAQARHRHRHPCVWLDDRSAAMEATAYLLGLGHRTVHYVAIPSSTRTSDRQAGWKAALESADAPVPAPIQAEWTPRSGYQAGRQLTADKQVTAILCGNDDLALGVLYALREAGRAVPDEVSVVGFDDAPQSEFYTPALTTVRLDFAGLGRDCFRLVRGLFDPPTAPADEPVALREAPTLVIRDTTGPPG
jgi:DNA-binding LacI/PurR family transcriptional regulator